MKQITEYLVNNHLNDIKHILSKLNIGDSYNYEGYDCIIAYKNNNETWLLSDYLYYDSEPNAPKFIMTCTAEERNDYNKNGWSIPTIDDILTVKNELSKNLSNDKLKMLFKTNMWLNSKDDKKYQMIFDDNCKVSFNYKGARCAIKLLKKIK